MQLEVAGGPVGADQAAPVFARLPHADGGASGVGHHGHDPELTYGHGVHVDLAAVVPGGLHLRGGVLHRQVHRPHIGGNLVRLGLHQAGHRVAILGEVGVPAVLGPRGLGGPAEKLAVEGLALLGVGRHQVDPAGGAGGNVLSDGHRSLPFTVVGSSLSP